METPTERQMFFGRIYPERAGVGVSQVDLDISTPGGAKGRLTVWIGASQIICWLDDSFIDDLHSAKNIVRAIVHTLTDVLAFTMGHAYHVEISGTDSARFGPVVFGVDFPGLAAAPPANSSETLYRLLLNDSDGRIAVLRRALGDFRRAIQEPDDTPFHCFRAVEALCCYFGRNADAGRPRLCQALGLDPQWIQSELEVPAGEIRHGKVVSVPFEVRERAILAARDVIDRFVTYAAGAALTS